MLRLVARLLNENHLAETSDLAMMSPAKYSRHELRLEASAEAHEVPMGGIGKASLVYLCSDRSISVAFNGSLEMRQGSLFILNGTDIESITVAAPEGADLKVFLGGE